MPPHLHPRSRLTTSLFTSTLAISFLVVGAPHILPCPVPPRAYADGEMDALDPGRRRRRRRKVVETRESCAVSGVVLTESEAEAGQTGGFEQEKEKERKRECPVPKPGGLVGQILGFEPREKSERTVVRVEAVRRRGREGGVDEKKE
ncbi:hypothetical protein K402DRAFT_389807 [Aulographum hederae CBS 113979]|uniref:Uncharacterized protein n=1 Tax=Aulographum hederae CBS 113979 TaxID=1176131 RepID=A0A6G1HCW2_9PEZI|nr:hypothetical protein K402DRAFT_389807 [Aulographum hederae CBS 113979]